MSRSTAGYRILEILGTGAYGTVCVARPHDRDHKVVIKVLRPELSDHPDILARTRDEARLLSRLSHPHIVAVEALTEHRGRPVIVMEHVDGSDLETVLHHHRAGLPAPIAFALIGAVASALDAAWESLRVVHRDLKPSNLLLSTDGTIKIVDFGLAHAEFEDRETQTQAQVLGSMGFMAPEQGGSGPTLPSVDVYALGITLVLLLVSRTLLLPRGPIRHDPELHRQLQLLQVPGISEEAQEALRRLLSRMCAFEPTERPSASQVVEVLATLAQPVAPSALAAFGEAAVARARSRRRPLPPARHPDWALVSFLDPSARRLLPSLQSAGGPLASLLRFFTQLAARPR